MSGWKLGEPSASARAPRLKSSCRIATPTGLRRGRAVSALRCANALNRPSISFGPSIGRRTPAGHAEALNGMRPPRVVEAHGRADAGDRWLRARVVIYERPNLSGAAADPPMAESPTERAMVPIAASAPTVVPIAASAPTDADSPRRASFSWLQHAETAILDDDWLRSRRGRRRHQLQPRRDLAARRFSPQCQPAAAAPREADLTRVAADVGRRSFARPPKPPCSRTNTSVSSSDCSSPRTTSISDSSRTPSPPPPRTLKRSSSWSAGTALPPMPRARAPFRR